MNGEIRILMLEDTPSDAKLVELALRRAEITFVAECVDTREGFVQALENFKPDIILADYKLPSFDGLAAVKIVRQAHPDIPVIMVSGALGDEGAVELLHAGAKDYVLKDHLARLAPAVLRTLSAEQGIHARKAAEKELHLSESRYRRLFEAARDGILLLNFETAQIEDVNPFLVELLGYTHEEFLGKKLWEVGLFQNAGLSKDRFLELQQHGQLRYENIPLETKVGERIEVEFVSNVYLAGEKKVIQCNIRDITERLRAEQALLDSEARYKRITEGLTDYQYTVRIENGRVVETTQSPSCVKMTGYKAEEFAANPHLWIQMVVPEDRELVVERVKQVLAGKDVPPIEHRIVRKDGESRWVSDTIILFKDASGKLLSYDGVIRDITERVLAEQAIHENEEKYRAIFENVRDIIFLLDNGGNFLSINQIANRIMGYTTSELIGRPFISLVHPDDLPRAMDVFQKILAGEILKSFEMRVLKKSGNYFDAELNLVSLTYANSLQVLGVARDISERKLGEATNMRLAAIVSSSNDAIISTTLDGVITSWNKSAEEMMGYTTKEIIGTPITKIIPPEIQAEIYALMKKVEEGNNIARHETERICKNGERIQVAISLSPMKDGSGKVTGISTISRDITERKRNQLALQESEATLRTITASAQDAIIMMDDDEKISFWNAAAEKIFGYSNEEALGQNLHRLLAPQRFLDDFHNGYGHFKQTGAGPVIGKTLELAAIGKNGVEFPVETSISGVLLKNKWHGIGVVRDITERKHAEGVLQKINRALRTISSCNEILIHASDESQLLNEMCRIIVEQAGYLLAWVGFAEHDEQKTVRLVAHVGYEEDYLERAKITWADNEHGRGPTGTAIRTQKPSVVQDAQTDPAYMPWHDNSVKLGYRSILALPLASLGQILGALTIYSPESNGFSEQEIRLLGELADDLAFGIITLRIRKLQELGAKRLMHSMEGSIAAMAATVEMRDPYTAGHQRRVAGLSKAIAQEMRLPDEDIQGIYLAAVIHDLGKIQVPAEILTKPVKLSTIEFQIIQTHPQAGYDILKEIDFPWPIAQMVYQHHEWLDGSGYPNGLKDAEILLGAKIIAVADTVEAMSSHRPYRPGLGIEAALEEITRMRGVRYDVNVVDTCVKLFRERGYSLPA